jgi:hypothetical protein
MPRKPAPNPVTKTENGETVRVWVNVECLSQYVGRDMSQVETVREYHVDSTKKPDQE